MGLTSNKATEKTTNEINLHTGIYPMKVVDFNPSKEELEKLLNAENLREPEYIVDDNFNEGHKQYLAYFWLTNEECIAKMGKDEVVVKEGTFKIPVIFGIGDSPVVTRDGSKFLWVNKYGKTVYAESEESLNYDWFSKDGLRKAHSGEQNLYEFLKAYANLYDTKDKTDENCLDDPKELFEDDTFFKNYVKDLIQKNHGIKLLIELKKTATNEEGNFNVKEVAYKQFFQKKTQKMPSAISNFKKFLRGDNLKKDKAEKVKRREPKGEYYEIEPTVLTISDAKEKVTSSTDDSDSDEMYKAQDSTF